MANTRQSSDTGTLGKAVSVLDAVAGSQVPLRFRDLAIQLDQPRGTLHRQISNLIEEGLLQVNPDQSYSLGLRLLKFAAQSWSRNSLRETAEPHLSSLHNLTGETIHLGVLQGGEVIYLDKIESKQTVRMHSQVGNASPCYCTGVGKAGLSVLPRDEALSRIAKLNFQSFTLTTLKDGEALIEELKEIDRLGVAFDREEHEPGIHCIAAPIYSADRSIVGGLSVTAPSYRVPMEQLEEWADEVRKTAQAIIADLPIKMGPRA